MSGLLNLPKLPTIKAEGRVHRIRDDEDEDQQPQQDSAGATHPRITPFIAADANGNVITAKGEPNMPKGHYERKPKAEAANDAPTLPAKRGRKPRILAVVPKVAKPNGHAPTGRFEVAVDLRAGAVTINAASGSLTLAPDEVLALFAFLARR